MKSHSQNIFSGDYYYIFTKLNQKIMQRRNEKYYAEFELSWGFEMVEYIF